MKKWLICIFLLCLFLAGCSYKPVTNYAYKSGDLVVSVSIPSTYMKGLDFPITKVVATITRGSGISPSPQEAIPSNGKVQFSFSNLDSGTWNLLLEAFDEGGFVSHKYSGNIEIKPASTTTVVPILKENLSTVKCGVDVRNLTAAGFTINNLRLFINGRQHSSSFEEIQPGLWSLNGSYGVGTASIKITAYNGDMLIWSKILPDAQFYPGRETILGSSEVVAQTNEVIAPGALQINNGVIITRPEPPTNVTATLTDTRVSLLWSPSSDLENLSFGHTTSKCYVIYVRINGETDMHYMSYSAYLGAGGGSYDIKPEWRGKRVDFVLTSLVTNFPNGVLYLNSVLAIANGSNPNSDYYASESKWSNIASVTVPAV